jgi:aryl-alcohol dehydrogenase-like predicted oxidoreductase
MAAMRYKLLGPSGMRVSELCLGTMSFGDAWGFGADQKQSHQILDAFAEAGGNFIDTANAYHEGQSEEILGSFLGPGRDRFVVATKYTLAMRSGDPNAAGNSRKNLAVFLALYLLELTSDAALIFYGASMLLAALRGYAGCEVLAVSNWLLRRDDQVGCAVFLPIDHLERR